MKTPLSTGPERPCQPLGVAARFGLIGHPIAGSGSPALFAKAYGGRWPYDLIDREHFEDAWAEFLRGYHAVNITAPFKELAFLRVQECGRVDASCLEIGAINIAVKTPDGIVGYNSDFLGVRKVLLDNGFGRAPDGAAEGPQGDSGRLAVIAGFGGAGKAAAAAARSLGLDVVVCNRSRRSPEVRPLEDLPVLAAAADILIYCLPFPIPEIEFLLNTAVAAVGESGLCILEANYRTPCLAGFRGRYIHGSAWLEAQATLGYPLMTGVPVEA